MGFLIDAVTRSVLTRWGTPPADALGSLMRYLQMLFKYLAEIVVRICDDTGFMQACY